MAIILYVAHALKQYLEIEQGSGHLSRAPALSDEWFEERKKACFTASLGGALLWNVGYNSKLGVIQNVAANISVEHNEYTKNLMEAGQQQEAIIKVDLNLTLNRVLNQNYMAGSKLSSIVSNDVGTFFRDIKRHRKLSKTVKKDFPLKVGASPDAFLVMGEQILPDPNILKAVIEIKFKAKGGEFKLPIDLNHYTQLYMQMMCARVRYGVLITKRFEDGLTHYQLQILRRDKEVDREFKRRFSEVHRDITLWYENNLPNTRFPKETEQALSCYYRTCEWAEHAPLDRLVERLVFLLKKGDAESNPSTPKTPIEPPKSPSKSRRRSLSPKRVPLPKLIVKLKNLESQHPADLSSETEEGEVKDTESEFEPIDEIEEVDVSK